MQKTLLLALALLTTVFVNAQSSASEVQWSYTAKKISPKVYEVHMTAMIGAGWHMYSQNAGNGPVPTSFRYTANPQLSATGPAKEKGRLITVFEKAFKSTVRYYRNTVDFIQIVQLRSPGKTNFSGNVEFMTCDDHGHQCLAPATQSFSVVLGG